MGNLMAGSHSTTVAQSYSEKKSNDNLSDNCKVQALKPFMFLLILLIILFFYTISLQLPNIFSSKTISLTLWVRTCSWQKPRFSVLFIMITLEFILSQYEIPRRKKLAISWLWMKSKNILTHLLKSSDVLHPF